MIQESLSPYYYPQGKFQDTLVGRDGQIIWQTPWQSNLIVEGMRTALAKLMMGEEDSLTHWAIGTGEPAWDDSPPPSEGERQQKDKLYNETGRQLLAGNMQVNGHELEIQADFTLEDIAQPDTVQNRQLREFGLIVGGSSGPDTGILINHRTHARIDMQEGFNLQRILVLTF